MNLLAFASSNLTRMARRSLLLFAAVSFSMIASVVCNGLTAGLLVNVNRNFSLVLGGDLFVTGEFAQENGKRISLIPDSANVQAAIEESIRETGLRAETVERYQLQTRVSQGTHESRAELRGLSAAEMASKLASLQIVESVPSTENETGIYVPESLAAKLTVSAGDTLFLRATSARGQASIEQAVVVGVVSDEISLGAASIIGTDTLARKLLGLKDGEAQGFALRLADSRDVAIGLLLPVLSRNLSEIATVRRQTSGGGFASLVAAGNADTENADAGAGSDIFAVPDTSEKPLVLSVSTINDYLGEILSVTDLLRATNIFLLAILLLVSAVGFSNTYRMILGERKREIGTLRALGMTRPQVLTSFMAESALLAAAGIVAGAIVGGILGSLATSVPVPADSRFRLFLDNGRLGFVFFGPQLWVTALVLCAGSVAAVAGPARQAANTQPVNALRTE